MKTYFFNVLISFTLTILATGCKKTEKNCGSIDFVPLDFASLKISAIGDETVADKFLVINSIEEYKRLVITDGGSESPGGDQIDFSRYTLLIGKKKLSALQGTLQTQSVDQLCGTDKYVYSLEIKNGGYTAIGNFYYGVLIPKLTSGSVETNIRILE